MDDREGWKTVEISSLCHGIYDGPHATPKKTSSGPVFLGISNLIGGRIDLSDVEYLSESDFAQWTRRVTPQEDDIVFSYETRLGEAAMIPADLRCCLGRRMALMRPNPSFVVPRFLLYAYLGPEFQDLLRARTIHGSTVDRIPLIDFPKFPVRVPPLDEQRAIAAILGALDDKIECNRRMNETLEAMARALFQSWFVDFDPVHAKAAGRQPFGMDAETAALFPAAFEDSPLGPIPEGWPTVRLADVCTTQYGYTASATGEAVGPHFLRVMDINKQNWIEWHSVPYCPISETDRSKYALNIGDIVVARMADPGKSAIIEQQCNAVFASYLVRLKASTLAHAYYIYGFLKSPAYKEYSTGAKSGSVQANMNAKVITAVDLVMPPTPILDAFLKQVQALRSKIVADVEQNHTLASLRDALLPKLLSGAVRVRDAEAVVGVAV